MGIFSIFVKVNRGGGMSIIKFFRDDFEGRL